jgi:hypothetical protein
LSCERLVDSDQDKLGLRRFEVLERPAVGADAQAARAPCGRKGGPTFGIGEDARGNLMARGPQVGGQVRAGFDHDELDER